MSFYPLAAATLRLWEDEVRRFAPDEHMRWQTLLERLPSNLTPAQLRDALCPLAAKNDKEQTLFAEIFERARAEVELLQAGIDDPPPPPPPSFWQKNARLLTALFLLAAGAGLWYYLAHKNATAEPAPERLTLYLTLASGSEKTACPDSADLRRIGAVRAAEAPDSRYSPLDGGYYADHIQLYRLREKRLDYSPLDSGYYADHPLGRLTLAPDGCVGLAASADTAGRDSLRFYLVAQRGRFPVDVFLDVQKISQSTVSRPLPPVSRPLSTVPRYAYPYDHDARARALAFEPPGALARWAGWIKGGALLLLAALLYAWVRRRAWKRRKLVARRDKSARPPYVWNLRLPDLAPPDPGDALAPALNALRRRADDDIRLLDLPATVRATIRRGGMAALRFRRQTKPPEYLLLVDRHDPRDHRARLYDDLYRVLRQNEVLVERFFFDGDARLCHNDAHPEGLGLDELLFRYPNHRLLLIGSGHALFSAVTGRLARWTELFARWKDRALLSPLPAAQWGRRERALADLFRFAPATLPGLRTLIEQFEAEDDETRAPKLAHLAALAPGDAVRLDAEGDLLHTLHKHYPDDTTRTWLAACALWPELHYDLTLWLGAWLEQERGQPVVTFERLTDLLRLPWFSSGEMPDPARAALLDSLRATHPELEHGLRTALHALLRDNAPPPDSAAWDDYALRVAFNEWMITTDPDTKKELEAKIARWLDTVENPDFIVVRELRGRPGPLDSLLPDAWKKRLFNGRIPALGLRDVWKDALARALPLWLAAAAALAFGWNPPTPTCNGLQADIRLENGETVHCCVNPYEEQLLVFSEYRLREAAQKRDTAVLDSAGVAAVLPEYYRISLTELLFDQKGNSPDLVAECRANIATALYNAGVPPAALADSLRRAQPGFRPDTSLCRRAACRWFEAALRWDTAGAWAPAARAWCAGPGVFPPPEGPACRRVANVQNGLGFRTRPLTKTEFAQLDRNENPALEQNTLIGVIPPGAAVELIDSTALTWKVRYNGRTGFVPRMYRGRPTLAACTTPRLQTGTAPAPGATDTLLTPALAIPLPDLVRIPGAAFRMGCPDENDPDCYDDEKPARDVSLSDFFMGRTEVTNEQYLAFLNERGNQTEGGREWINLDGSSDGEKCRIRQDAAGRFSVEPGYEKHPVIYVSWYGARAYCAWLGAKTGRAYRLPTEAEWEYAAGNGKKHTKYSWGNNPPAGKKGGNVADETAKKQYPDWIIFEGYTDGYVYAAPVGAFDPNEFGLFDMTGNVWEWCEDDWHDNYEGAPTDGRAWLRDGERGSDRVARGGSWGGNPQRCRVSRRGNDGPGDRFGNVGFRVVASPQ